MHTPLDNIAIAKILWSKKKTFFVVMLAAAAIAVVGTLLMPNYYESTVTFFPSNPSLTDRSVLFQKDKSDAQNTFGDKLDADRLISIGKSGQISAYCVASFRLFEHYNIDSTAKYAQFKMRQRFAKNYDILKNGLGGVEVHVLDTDPKLAALMANAIVKKIDEINTGMVNSNKKEIVELFAGEVSTKKEMIAVMQDSVRALQSAGFDSVRVNTQKTILRSALHEYNDAAALYNQYLASANKSLSSVYIVEKAYASDKKVKPVRSLLVIGFVGFVLVCSLLFFVVLSRLRSVDWSA